MNSWRGVKVDSPRHTCNLFASCPPHPPTYTHGKNIVCFFFQLTPLPPPNTHTQADTDMVFAFFANMLCCSMSPITPMVFTFLFYCSHQIIRMAHMMRFMQSAFCDSLYQIIRMAHMMQFTRSLLFVTVYIRSSEWPTLWDSQSLLFVTVYIRSSEWPTWCNSHGLCFLWQFISDHQNGPHDAIHTVFAFCDSLY